MLVPGGTDGGGAGGDGDGRIVTSIRLFCLLNANKTLKGIVMEIFP